MSKNSSQHKLAKQKCPVCGLKKLYPERQETCSSTCGYKLRSENYHKSNSIDDKAPHEITLADRVRAVLKAKKKPLGLTELCNTVQAWPGAVNEAIDELRQKGFRLEMKESGIQFDSAFSPEPKRVVLTHETSDYEGKWIRFGVCGDKHLGNMHSRLDVMKLLYDIYEAEGITTVFDTGNWIDGEARFNKGELLVHGMDAQLDYWIENHPQRKGITTKFVAGDDHEGWYQQRECLEIGRYAELRAKAAGRNDLEYLGYAESLIELKAARGSRFMMVNHPGGGASYAISYKGQKYVESLQGGEKPAIVLQGHYHKFNLGYPREVWVVDTGTCCDQTLFMRKKQLQAHVGGQIIEFMQAPDGRITRFRVEFLPFYDRNFYESQRRRFGLPARLKRAA